MNVLQTDQSKIRTDLSPHFVWLCSMELVYGIFLYPEQIETFRLALASQYCSDFLPDQINMIAIGKTSKWCGYIVVFLVARKPHTQQNCFEVWFYKVCLADINAGVRSWRLNFPFAVDFRMATPHFDLKLSLDGDWKLISRLLQGCSNVQAFYNFARSRVVCQWNLMGKWRADSSWFH